MTDTERALRDFYIAMRRLRGGKPLRLCNRMPERQAPRGGPVGAPLAIEAPAV